MPNVGVHGQGTGPFKVTTPTGQERWRVAVTMADGRRVWRTRTTYRAAEAARKGLVEARELDLDPTRLTLAGYLRSWIEGLRDGRRIRPRTLDHYAMIVETHIIPDLGGIRLASLTARRIQAWVDADPASPRTVHHHRAVLRRALNVAVRQRLLPWNPAMAVELPRVTGDHADPLTLEEARRLIEATKDDRLGVLWRLAIVTGLRQGELLGLTWEDVNDGPLRSVSTTGTRRDAGPTVGATPRVISGQGAGDIRRVSEDRAGPAQDDVGTPVVASLKVHRQLQRLSPERGGDANGWARTPTKAARKLEVIALDEATAAALDAHRIRQAAERTAETVYWGMVFRTEAGFPYHSGPILDAFHEACVKAGIRKRRFHDLRGTTASLMAAAGVTEDVRQARLGHATKAMARHYAGASTEQDQAAVELLARRLG
jgi:integrase